ncbi:hypothetical protein J3D48_001183 [Pseudomonas fluorescens]|jgi:hypothetical protein|nr:hypothetical protein [Pseudomonas fluorescens]
MKKPRDIAGFFLPAEKTPHPSPLPEGEGTDWGMLQRYADLILLC